MAKNKEMTHKEIFARLKKMGAASAEVRYSGGHDSGAVERITLHDKDGKEIGEVRENTSVQVWDEEAVEYQPIIPNSPENDLAVALAKPVWDKYKGFAGEYSAEGRVLYDVKKKSVRIVGTESVEEHTDIDEEV